MTKWKMVLEIHSKYFEWVDETKDKSWNPYKRTGYYFKEGMEQVYENDRKDPSNKNLIYFLFSFGNTPDSFCLRDTNINKLKRYKCLNKFKNWKYMLKADIQNIYNKTMKERS